MPPKRKTPPDATDFERPLTRFRARSADLASSTEHPALRRTRARGPVSPIPEATEPAEKRRRTGARNTESNTTGEKSQKDEPTHPDETPDVVPVRRGRPRNPSASEVVPKTKPARPTRTTRPKTQVQSQHEDEHESDNKAVLAPTRRGRPRKAAPSVPQNSKTSRRTQIINTVASEPHNIRSNDTATQSLAPVRRGRPRKAATLASQKSKPSKKLIPDITASNTVEARSDTEEREQSRGVEGKISPRHTRSRKLPNRALEPSAALHPSSKVVDVPIAGPLRSQREEVDESGESSEDELLLSPRKRHPHPPSTPPPNGRNAPRLVLHSVEIVTPRGVARHLSRIKSPTISPRNALVKRTGEGHDANPLILYHAPIPERASSINPTTPSKRNSAPTPQASPSRVPRTLPAYLCPCLNTQKRAILSALRNPSSSRSTEDADNERSANCTALEQLKALLVGTTDRGEGNSCLVIGPRGSGKSQIVNEAISSLPGNPIIIRLSGYVQHNDRLAMREIARQLALQNGKAIDAEVEVDMADDENPFIERSETIPLPPPSHLPTLISALPTLGRPTIIILDAFDLFAQHGRQALLYCLLDTAQSCRAGAGGTGIAVIGVTPRVDTITLLEKRVKSRFSGRMIRTAGPTTLQDWNDIARNVLCPPVENVDDEWTNLWSTAIEQFLEDRTVKESLSETFGVMRDVRLLCRILTNQILELTPSNPFPKPSRLQSAIATQRVSLSFPSLSSLSYPSICLLIAATHARTAGHDSATFEMLYETFRIQLRTSLSAPVQVDGGGIGMVKSSRGVLMAAFEHLITTKIFTPQATITDNTGREFVRYRCMVERDEVKKTVEAVGQTSLKKWFFKAQ